MKSSLFNRCAKILLLISLAPGTALATGTPLSVQEVEEKRTSIHQLPEPELRKQAKAGDPVAKYVYYIKTVEDQPEDPARWERARTWLQQASDAGVPHANYSYARRFVNDDHEKYYSLLQRAAGARLPGAQYQLALEHLEGQRAPLDEPKAVSLMQQAADAGYLQAWTQLAALYASGLGEPRHPGETPFELYRKAAHRGEPEAMRELGRRYRYGYGTEQNLLEAVRFCWRARQHGYSEVSPLLAQDLDPIETGNTEDKVFTAFYSLYVKANVLREPETMRKVGRAFLNGQYGAANPQTGYFWLSFASRRGDAEATKLLPAAKEKLNPNEITQVDRELDQMIGAPRYQSRPQR